MPSENSDLRTTATLVRQYDVLSKIKRDLVKQGQLNGSATPQEVIATLRRIIPADLWTAK